MDLSQQKLAIGCLLHDFGKLLYRYNDGRNHSTSGYEYLVNINELKNEKEILNCVRYHHSVNIKSADISNNELCYIAYIADNIASSSDRRAKPTAEGGFVKDIASESIFNIINGNSDNKIYRPDVLSAESDINYPVSNEITFNDSFYGGIIENIDDSIRGIEFSNEYINSLLQLLESNLSFIPSSTQTGELRDISLYDHLKLTAAFGLCIKQYLDEKNITDYKSELYLNATKFYDKKVFRICSIDLSGIQAFIYNISSTSALKGLRARSFYLEILMEHCVDELLDMAGLCRANVMYTGGGHTYVIMSATDKTEDVINKFEDKLNKWFLKNFGIALYAAVGYADCSSNNLQNNPKGSYKLIFREISNKISSKKLSRYTNKEIMLLNAHKECDLKRECIVCGRSDNLNKESECIICSGLKKLSDMIISDRSQFFAIMKETNKACVPMPFDSVVAAYTEAELIEIIKNHKDKYVRAFSKNKGYTGYKIASNLWVGDYSAEKTFADLAYNSNGIKRLAVLRADVDNLGQAFVAGFNDENNGDKYCTITRTAVFSRKLSEFFKLHINKILSKGEFYLYTDSKPNKRNIDIVYSGGDDVFVVGGWDDVIGFAIDLYNAFKKFTQGQLTISAGIGIYNEKFPIYAMASKTGELEELSKHYNNDAKNAVTLFSEESIYSWDEFINKVIGEKLRAIEKYISYDSIHAKVMLYKMLDLIRKRNEENRLNIARFAYYISKLKPDLDPNDESYINKIENYNKFSKNMYRWIQDEYNCKQLITAIYIYIYMNRAREENGNEN